MSRERKNSLWNKNNFRVPFLSLLFKFNENLKIIIIELKKKIRMELIFFFKPKFSLPASPKNPGSGGNLPHSFPPPPNHAYYTAFLTKFSCTFFLLRTRGQVPQHQYMHKEHATEILVSNCEDINQAVTANRIFINKNKL